MSNIAPSLKNCWIMLAQSRLLIFARQGFTIQSTSLQLSLGQRWWGHYTGSIATGHKTVKYLCSLSVPVFWESQTTQSWQTNGNNVIFASWIFFAPFFNWERFWPILNFPRHVCYLRHFNTACIIFSRWQRIQIEWN